jgi:hypothetical protein
MILTENHVIPLEDLFRINPKHLEKKLREIKRWVPSPSYPGKCAGEEEGEGP